MGKTRFVLRSSDIVARCLEFITRCNDFERPKEVVIQEYKKNRSLEQNALMWAWATELSEAYHAHYDEIYSPETWKIHMQTLFLGYKELQMPGGAIESQLVGTSKLGTKAFSEFLEKWDAHCVTEYGIQMSHINPHYAEAMGYA